jgi:hypothetical protein
MLKHNQWSEETTLKKARTQLNAIGVTLRVENDEFILRIKRTGARYYTKCLDDALDTGFLIADLHN